MPWSFGRKRMVHRRCLDCGETWTLEASLARLRAGRPHGYAAGLRGGPLGQAIAERQVAEAEAGLDQELETIRQARTCPKCGSERYKDRRI
jgi:predicted nucleic-acid-binding Zn-ribbon protein